MRRIRSPGRSETTTARKSPGIHSRIAKPWVCWPKRLGNAQCRSFGQSQGGSGRVLVSRWGEFATKDLWWSVRTEQYSAFQSRSIWKERSLKTLTILPLPTQLLHPILAATQSTKWSRISISRIFLDFLVYIHVWSCYKSAKLLVNSQSDWPPETSGTIHFSTTWEALTRLKQDSDWGDGKCWNDT